MDLTPEISQVKRINNELTEKPCRVRAWRL